VPYSLGHDLLTEGAPGFDDQAQSGTIGETYVIGPSMVNSLRLSVNRIAAQQSLDVRIECFNPTNSLRRGDPATTLSAANTFGRILNDATPPPGISGPGVIGSATKAPARVFQFALKYIF